MSRFDTAQVRLYYERHTPAFVRLGHGRRTGAIHRAVWGPGVSDRPQAFHFVEDRIIDEIRPSLDGRPEAHVVDLGCGVGASLCHIAQRLPVRATGITLSPLQVRLATERIRAHGLSERVACIEGDYCNLPAAIGRADAAYAIESFVHSPSVPRFFAQCRQLVRPGGILAICDDFRRPSTDPVAAPAIDAFCRGWHVNALLRLDELHAFARAAGFEPRSTLDLSPYLEIRRVRDRLIRMVRTLTRWLPIDRDRYGPLEGGDALQTCLARGWIGYELVVFRRDSAA